MASTPVTCRYDLAQLKAFDEAKEGVKGLVDAGITVIPDFFVHSQESLNFPPQASPNTSEIPCIDMQGGDEKDSVRRRQVVEEIRHAASTWGFFRIVNHGVPIDSMDTILEATRRFHEQPTEAKKEFYYSHDLTRMVKFTTHVPYREFDPASWRDQLGCKFLDDTLDPESIPQVCRAELCDYAKHMIKLRETMAELLSEAIGLPSDYLSKLECMKSELLGLLYYPKCPQPDRTLGTPRHSDPTFMTVLLLDNNNIGGLQVLHDNQWVDVSPEHGSLIVNLGDSMQIITNDKFKSVEHRVLAQPIGPRVSVACFFNASSKAMSKPLGPIKEIVSNENPAVYRELTLNEYLASYSNSGHFTSTLPRFKL